MEPFTLISGALSILKATGLDEKLGSLLFGEKGAKVAEKVVGIAQGVTGATDLTSVVKDVQKDALLSNEVTLALIEQESELYKLAMADRADAREMQKSAFQQNDRFVKRFIYYFAGFWSIVASVYIGCITFMDIPADNIRFADVVLGFLLGTIISTIIQFFYGSMLKQQDATE